MPGLAAAVSRLSESEPWVRCVAGGGDRGSAVEGTGVTKRSSDTLGSQLAALAAEKGLSVRALARALHVDQSYLSRIITGDAPASGAVAGRVAEVLGLPVDYFPEYREWRLVEAIHQDPELRDRLFDRYGKS